MNRRNVLKTGLTLAGGSLLASNASAKKLMPEMPAPNTLGNISPGGGKLEVSSVGLGVQNMSRTYQTTMPTRPEMHNVIRKAFDNGVTLFDAAEAF